MILVSFLYISLKFYPVLFWLQIHLSTETSIIEEKNGVGGSLLLIPICKKQEMVGKVTS